MARPLTLTAQGIESQLGINHLGHFVLTVGLRPALGPSGRVVTVATAAHTRGDARRVLETLTADRAFSGRRAQHRLDASGDLQRALQRGPGGRLHVHDEEPLVLGGHETARHAGVHVAREREPDGEEREPGCGPPEHGGERAAEARRHRVEPGVDGGEEPPAGVGLRVEEARRERGRERQGVEGRERDRERDRERELFVEPPRGAREQRDGHEHRDQCRRPLGSAVF